MESQLERSKGTLRQTDSIQLSGQGAGKGEARGLATVCLFHAALGNVGQMCV